MKKTVFILGMIFSLFSCEKSQQNVTIDDFKNATPDGWVCELNNDNYNFSDHPENPSAALVKIDYKFIKSDAATDLKDTTLSSLTIELYPIKDKTAIIDFVNAQKVFSWCIPVLYGETNEYLVLTSPCFVNRGVLNDNGELKIDELHNSLNKLFTTTYYSNK